MASETVRIGLCGLGTIGRQAGRLLIDHRTGFEIVGAATLEEDAVGRLVSDVVESSRGDVGPTVVGNIESLLAAQPEVVIYSTGSFLEDTAEEITAIVDSGAHVVSPCEELAFPYGRFADAARQIDDAARAQRVSVLGTGVNPGFIFDALLATATGVCWDAEAIRGRRIVDVVGFGENIHRRLGIGYSSDEFEHGHETGSIAGHVGFPESVEMVCERLGLDLDGPVEETFEPMLAETPAPTRYGEVAIGRTEGFIQRAVGRVGGETRIQLELILHLRPNSAGLEPSDSIEIDGIHSVRLRIAPGMDAILATSAQLVNSIPVVLAAPPGLLSVKDLPPTTAWLGGLGRRMIRGRDE